MTWCAGGAVRTLLFWRHGVYPWRVMWVQVKIDQKKKRLWLEATGAKLRASTPDDDALPAPNMTGLTPSAPATSSVSRIVLAP